VDPLEPGAASRELCNRPTRDSSREPEGRDASEHGTRARERRPPDRAEGQPAGGGEHRSRKKGRGEHHPCGERGGGRSHAGREREVAQLGGRVGQEQPRRDDQENHGHGRGQASERHPAEGSVRRIVTGTCSQSTVVDVSCVLHLHSTYSDGTATVEEIIAAAAAAGVDLVLLTDHDSLGARRNGWEGRHGGVALLVGTEVSPKQGHYLAFGVDREIPHDGRSAVQIARAVRDAGGVGFAAHPFSDGGRMLVPGLARRIVLPHGWPALDDPEGCDGIELWSLTTDAAEAWRTPAEAVRWLRDPERAIAPGPPPHHLRRWDALSSRRRVPAIGGLDGHQPGFRVRGRVRSPLPHRRTFDLLRTHLLCERALTGDVEDDWQTVLAALAAGAAWLTCPCVAPAHGARLWVEQPDGTIVPMGGEGAAVPSVLRVRLPRDGQLLVIRDGAPIREAQSAGLDLPIDGPGAYRVEARIGGRLWLLSNPVHLRALSPRG